MNFPLDGGANDHRFGRRMTERLYLARQAGLEVEGFSGKFTAYYLDLNGFASIEDAKQTITTPGCIGHSVRNHPACSLTKVPDMLHVPRAT